MASTLQLVQEKISALGHENEMGLNNFQWQRFKEMVNKWKGSMNCPNMLGQKCTLVGLLLYGATFICTERKKEQRFINTGSW